MARAVDTSGFTFKNRLALQIQSRVHSKGGRSFGKLLGRFNVPIMSINSVLQILVPPPKYRITSLLPARIATDAPLSDVFLMERGAPLTEHVGHAETVDQLIENTDDAYGFPPFATLAPTFVIGGDDYLQLRLKERELLTRAIENATIWRLRVSGHEWGELIPKLVAESRSGLAPAAGMRSGVEPRPHQVGLAQRPQLLQHLPVEPL
jgi:hypothetical protein